MPRRESEISAFSRQNSTRRPRRNVDDVLMVRGRRGTIVDYGGNGLLKAIYEGSTGSCPRTVRALEKAGCDVFQVGDSECGWTFDPLDGKQCTATIKAIKVFKRRQLAPATRKRIVANLARWREEQKQK